MRIIPACGRFERSFGAWQGRLPQELRLHGITTLEAANRFLQQHYVRAFYRMRLSSERISRLLGFRGHGVGLHTPCAGTKFWTRGSEVQSSLHARLHAQANER